MATTFNDQRYQPKGGMCMTCKKKTQDCSRLPFHAMPVIQATDFNSVRIVRCTHHERITPPAP